MIAVTPCISFFPIPLVFSFPLVWFGPTCHFVLPLCLWSTRSPILTLSTVKTRMFVEIAEIGWNFQIRSMNFNITDDLWRVRRKQFEEMDRCAREWKIITLVLSMMNVIWTTLFPRMSYIVTFYVAIVGTRKRNIGYAGLNVVLGEGNIFAANTEEQL